MIPGSSVLLLILSNLLLQMDFHAVQMCEWLGVLYQSLLDSLAQPNWGEAAGKELRPLFLFRTVIV
jgi:hypothetical protein